MDQYLIQVEIIRTFDFDTMFSLVYRINVKRLASSKRSCTLKYFCRSKLFSNVFN